MEEASVKRRKLDHFGSAATSIDAGIHRQNTFSLETDELLKEARPDYQVSFPDSRHVLERLRVAIEKIESHDSIPVRDANTFFVPRILRSADRCR